jgi:FKBP-type peptidyl-prolyl cis-trans isomerase|tara:strand:- start:8555 stop:8770 length:216 start_codon:yes stop_codon:yes gene_type:complete
VFDQTTGKPFKFRLGLSQVIRGWDLGIASMRVGGRRTIICPPHLAYGNKSPGAPIPANATLTFEVELVKAK